VAEFWGEFAELRAEAGFKLCLLRIRMKQLDKARDACRQVITMPDAAQETKANARKLLDKLEKVTKPNQQTNLDRRQTRTRERRIEEVHQ